jgi:hypothetical protein
MASRMSKRQTEALAGRVNAEATQTGSSGWSVGAYGKQAGADVTDSYMVALPKEQVAEPLTAPVSSRAIQRYQKKFKGLLKGEGMYHGGWIPSEGVGSQDVSEALPRTDEGFMTAYTKGVQNRQQAIGEIDASGGYVGSIDIPEHLHSGQFWSKGVKGEPMRPSVTSTDKVVKITPSEAEMARVYASEELAKRKEK